MALATIIARVGNTAPPRRKSGAARPGMWRGPREGHGGDFVRQQW